MSRLGLALTTAVAVAAAFPAAAQSHRLTAAWDAAIAEGEGYLEPSEMAQINVIAYHAAVARLCAGFEVDAAKLAAASNTVIAGATEGLADAALIDRHSDVLITIGTTHGLFLAEGSLHLDTFCAEAAETRADPEFDHLWK